MLYTEIYSDPRHLVGDVLGIKELKSKCILTITEMHLEVNSRNGWNSSTVSLAGVLEVNVDQRAQWKHFLDAVKQNLSLIVLLSNK